MRNLVWLLYKMATLTTTALAQLKTGGYARSVKSFSTKPLRRMNQLVLAKVVHNHLMKKANGEKFVFGASYPFYATEVYSEIETRTSVV